jgi:hypothetical protein
MHRVLGAVLLVLAAACPAPALEEAAFEPRRLPSQQALLEEADGLFAARAQRQAAEEAASRMQFFEAIADGNTRAFCLALNAGMDPDAEIPFPPPEQFVRRFEDRRLRYYVGAERGFTALMLAASLGNEAFVRILLEAGASPHKKTLRHKTFALWLAGHYGHIEIMRLLMGIGPADPVRQMRLHVSLATQHATLRRGNEILFEAPVSTGKPSHPTPSGSYLVTNKYRMWTSTLYAAKMPNYLRLSCQDFGLHAGNVPGHPASHGCIRLPHAKAKELFSLAEPGLLVEIE